MASPAEIKEFFKNQEILAKANRTTFDNLIKTQRSEESKIIYETQSFCPIDKITDYTARAEDIKQALEKGYGDGNILKALMCLNNSMVMFPKNKVGTQFKTRQFLEGLTQIGSESAFGYATKSGVKSVTGAAGPDDLFVVKSPRIINPKANSDQMHEYFVGVFGTNNLRDKIPNFAYVIGFFECSPPYIDNATTVDPSANPKERKALTFCQNNSPDNLVNYLMYENIKNAKSVKDFIKDGCSAVQFANILTQIVLSLDLANRELDFSHYDLHWDNVLVKKLAEPIYIPYVVEGKTYYLLTDEVATIIDFGQSHIKYNGEDFGFNVAEGGIMPNRSYAMNDIYKFIMFSLWASIGGDQIYVKKDLLINEYDSNLVDFVANKEVFYMFKDIIKYFYGEIAQDQEGHVEGAADYLTIIRNDLYTLPYYPEYDLHPSDFFRDVLVQGYGDLLNTFLTESPQDPLIGIYGCSYNNQCLTLKTALNEFSRKDVTLLDDPYVFYEVIVETENKKQPVNEIIDMGRPNLEEALNKLMDDIDANILATNNLSVNLELMGLGDVTDEYRFDEPFIGNYRKYIAKVVKIIDNYTLLKQMIVILNKYKELYPVETRDLEETINQYNDNINIGLNNSNEYIRLAVQDSNYIASLAYEANNIIRNYPMAKWIFEKLPGLAAAIKSF